MDLEYQDSGQSVRQALQFKKLRKVEPIFHLATLFAGREAKTRIRQRDWLKLAGEKIRREQVGTVPTFLSVHANKFAKWKIGFRTLPKNCILHLEYQDGGDELQILIAGL